MKGEIVIVLCHKAMGNEVVKKQFSYKSRYKNYRVGILLTAPEIKEMHLKAKINLTQRGNVLF